MRKIRTAVLISGRGSNMAALAQAAKSDSYPADIALVISNIPDALGLDKAKELGVPAKTIDHKQFSDRRAFETALDAALTESDIELVCCAGFMRILTPWFVNRWKNRLLNIHPSLLPKYKGLNTHQRAIDAGDKEHGCTVHYVTAELDGGATILQHALDIEGTDTADSLAQRLLPHEQDLYVEALKKVASEMLSVSRCGK
ncbi:phosphoribosylglycinamide formyltransferase [Hellea sp.]|nr:phosphoribosylglycinamide formyltransferase [Hellea sp.]